MPVTQGEQACKIAALDSPSTETSSEAPELAEIFRSLGKSFIDEVGLQGTRLKAFRDIVECRTGAKGGHLWRCQECRASVIQYNSCLNRHCPKCQGPARRAWVARQMGDLLPIPYFHVVFTIPHHLNGFIRFNPKLLDLLFHAASRTLLGFARDPQHLGAEPGILMVLHTWGQKLNLHYHVHCIVTGGGLGPGGRSWVSSKSKKYLFPVKAMSKVFRGIYLEGLERSRQNRELEMPGRLQRFQSRKQWDTLLSRLYEKAWVVYAKPPFGSPEQVLKYLGRYTHRVAISNQRILAHKNGMVTFSYKDYRKDGSWRKLTLAEKEFGLRFLQHVLPKGLRKIRFYGLLANRTKKEKLKRCRFFLGHTDLTETNPAKPETLREDGNSSEAFSETGESICPSCNKVSLVRVQELSPTTRHLSWLVIWQPLNRGSP